MQPVGGGGQCPGMTEAKKAVFVGDEDVDDVEQLRRTSLGCNEEIDEFCMDGLQQP